MGETGEPNESRAAERREDNSIDELSKYLGGEMEGWEINEWWTNLE